MNIKPTELIRSNSERETEDFAARLARRLKPGCVIALYGDLGAGKTVFCRGFARGLNIIEPVSSPTYTIIQEYPLENGGWFFHLDLYRIDTPQAALAFGVEEYLEAPDAYTVIEWPERIENLLPAHTIQLHIEHDGEESRTISREKRENESEQK
ncbi:MAG: tRNA (adenosine(37)-N6)-threonylcarbamoyltransferase complex ATPase subunit type 1 TsaE [Victivallaceae bacterium]|nr:tRNA (adenosine(37)-N6)-threonylcarbamoyltransferase complex ATPase subunit type 1 TsaE [Victivallaceae bacterium]